MPPRLYRAPVAAVLLTAHTAVAQAPMPAPSPSTPASSSPAPADVFVPTLGVIGRL